MMRYRIALAIILMWAFPVPVWAQSIGQFTPGSPAPTTFTFTVAPDGQSLATQSAETIQRFRQAYGDRAAVEWTRQHDNALAHSWFLGLADQAFDCDHLGGSCTQQPRALPVPYVVWCTKCDGPPDSPGECDILITEVDIHPNSCEVFEAESASNWRMPASGVLYPDKQIPVPHPFATP